MAVTLTAAAAEHIRKSLSQRGKGVGLRFGVRKAGCSGWAYQIDYADEAKATDLQFEADGVTVLVDPDSLPFIEGTQIDYRRQGLNATFHFENPNVKDNCGCGESFTV
jgi:iron-sulfur cluster assembly protein